MSSAELKSCINEWFADSSGARNFTVDGDSSFVVCYHGQRTFKINLY